jgi:hypothetical protein
LLSMSYDLCALALPPDDEGGELVAGPEAVARDEGAYVHIVPRLIGRRREVLPQCYCRRPVRLTIIECGAEKMPA